MPIYEFPFKHEFRINKFKESLISFPQYEVLSAYIVNGFLSVQGNGKLPENKNFVMLRFEKSLDTTILTRVKDSAPRFLTCICILYVLDSDGEKRLPRTFTFQYDSIPSDMHEERYIERAYILNNASEYLQEDTLTVIAEGTVEEWDEPKLRFLPFWGPLEHKNQFHVEDEEDLKVSLRASSVHKHFLMLCSTVFREAGDERYKGRFSLSKEELPAFLCMLVFIEIKKLVLYEATIFDLYKLADKYNIPEVLDECRKHIAEYLPRNASTILEFANFYYDTELKRTSESYIEGYSHEMRECSDNLEVKKEMGKDFGCDTRPVFSNLINTKGDFEQHLKNLWKKIVSDILIQEAIDYVPLSEIGKDPEPFDFYQ